MKSKMFLALLLMLYIHPGLCQVKDSVLLKRRSYRLFSPDTSGFKRKLILEIDNRNSFVRNSPVKIHGLNIGYAWHKKMAFGIGVYKINKHFFAKKKSVHVGDMQLSEINMYYITPNFSYKFYQRRFLVLGIPLESGIGTASVQRMDPSTGESKYSREYFVPLQFGINGLFKINRWIGLEAMAGYRYLLFQSKGGVFKTFFNSWYYSYGVQIFLGNVIGDLRYQHKYNRQQKRLKKESVKKY